jgi:hypothetical protein
MATTGTYAFNPSAADVVLNAFGMCGVRRTMLTTEHLENAAFAANLVGVDFTNRNPNRWKMVEVDVTLVAGTATYTLDPQVVAVSAVWLNQTVGSNTISRMLGPLSATEYASIANKTQTGTPNSYFFSLLTPSPTVTLWLVPNQVPEYSMKLQTFQQQQDVRLSAGYTLDTPYRFLDAYTWALAARLAVYYPDPARPSLPADLNTTFEAKFALAAQLDQERVTLKLSPNLGGYYPR